MLLKKSAIDAMPGEHKTHFLNANAQRLNKSLGDTTGMKSMGIHLITVEPGRDSTEHHFHHFEEEAIYVLSGTGIVHIGDEQFAIGAGDFIGCPIDHVPHSMEATGSEPLQCLVVGNRLNADVSDYPRQAKRLYRYPSGWDLVDVEDVTNVK
ncbi:cupin [Idiomarina sp. OT37-5b]|uniref:cupin domain-containing protein n=1 Tax=Idiomarina sp. OT37-5b TaxID=2100422 RepID=UPI000CF9A26A|nr:cupin domain-containing protein [Idiomarina sp. OT37-5b]AVJ55844.1 cupin [Idiomarina sp. OT37-5b]